MFNWFKKKIELKNENVIINSVCEGRGTKIGSEIIIPNQFEAVIYHKNRYHHTLKSGKYKFDNSLLPKLFSKRKNGKMPKRVKIALHYINKGEHSLQFNIKKQGYTAKFVIDDCIKFAELMLLYTCKVNNDYAKQYLTEIFQELIKINHYKIEDIPQTAMFNYGIKIIELNSSLSKTNTSIFNNSTATKTEPAKIISDYQIDEDNTAKTKEDTEPIHKQETQNCCPKCKFPIKFATKYCLRCGNMLEE